MIISSCASNDMSTKNYDHAIDFTVNKSGVKDYWVNKGKRKSPEAPIKSLIKNGYLCTKLSFVISEEGKAEDIEIVKAYPDRSFVKSSKRVLKRSSWKPAPTNPELIPVKVVVTYEATLGNEASKNTHCA